MNIRFPKNMISLQISEGKMDIFLIIEVSGDALQALLILLGE